MGFLQTVVRLLMSLVIHIFFREADGLNVDKLPKGPLIFVCAPHANQVGLPVHSS